MSITTELRDFVDELACHRCTRDRFSAIADRIDREHEECEGFCRRLEDAASKGEEVTLFGTDYIQLPKDADGEYIHIGDELETYHYEDGTVAGIQYYETGRTLIAVRPHGWDTPTWQDPESYTHAKPDSWERIIHDALRGAERDGAPDTYPELVAELVERCKRLAGEVE